MRFLGSNVTEMRWRPGLCWWSLERSSRPLTGFDGGSRRRGKGQGEAGKGWRWKGIKREKEMEVLRKGEVEKKGCGDE